jgi:hypothetical protein
MTNWINKVKLTHLFTEKEDHESVQNYMIAIAKVIESEKCFFGFDTQRFYEVPEGGDVLKAVDFANKLINRMYDFADSRNIWIE